MCFFEQHIYECGDSRLGKSRQHCERETRPGKTCGTRSIRETIYLERKCVICIQLDERLLQRSKDVETIEKLMAEGGKDRPALEAAIDSILFLDFDIKNLRREREEKKETIQDDLPPYTPPSPTTGFPGFQGMQQPQSQQPLLPGIDLNQVSPAALALLASSLLQTERVIYQRQELLFSNSNQGSASHSPLRGKPSTMSQSAHPYESEAARPSSIHSPYASRNSSVYVSRTNSPFVSRNSSPMPSSIMTGSRSTMTESRSTMTEAMADVPPFVSLVRSPTYEAEEETDKGKGKEEAGNVSPISPSQETSNEGRRASAEYLSSRQDSNRGRSQYSDAPETEREETVTWKCKCGETFVSSRSSGIEDISSLHICDAAKSRSRSRSRTPSPLRFWRNKSASK